MYKINSIKELKSYFIDNNINNSNDLGNLGLDYWNNKLKPLINIELFKKPTTKEELKNLINISFPLLLIDISYITNIKTLFGNFDELKDLKSYKYWNNPLNYLGFWNTKKIKDISYCFYNQKFFNQRIFWNTEKVENADSLFYESYYFNQPVTLNLKKCHNISNIFFGCYKLNSKIELNSLDNVEYSYGLFSHCENLNQPIELNLPNCKNISEMFFSCKKLNSKIILNNIVNAKIYEWLFYDCKNLKFKNIKSIIDQLIVKSLNVNELEKKIRYQIPEEHKNQINNKSFFIVNQI